MPDKILITGARAAVALDIARDFAAAGYEVHMADCSSAFIARLSGIPAYVHKYASPAKNRPQFFADMRAIAAAVQPKIIIPTCEEVFYLRRALQGTKAENLVFAPEDDTLHTLHNKYAFAHVCAGIGLDVPETHLITQPENLRAYTNNAAEWVFKPCYSRFGAATLIAPAPEKLAAIRPDEKSPWVAQKFIRGKEMSFYAIAKAGALCALAVYASSWRLGGGASYVFEPVSQDIFNAVKTIAARLAATCGLTGQFSCDFIRDEAGKIWLIECNPRATSGLHLLQGRLAAAIMGPVEAPVAAAARVKYMLPIMLIYGFTKAMKAGRMKSWFATLYAGKDVIGGRCDRLPVLGAMIDTGIFTLHSLRKGISLAQATTADIEWNGESLS